MGLLGGHGRCADHDAVHGHVRQVVGAGPLAADVVGRPLRGADAAAGHQNDVGAGTNLGVGGREQVVQGLPGVVASGGPAFDLHENAGGGDLAGDGHDLADLVHCAGLEGHVGEALFVELMDQGHGLVQLRDACRDDHPVDGGAGGALLGHDVLAAKLEVPQVAVHEHGVELDRAALLQLVLQLRHVAVEDLSGHLAAAGQLGPVAGIGGRSDDLGLHSGRGHAGQHDRGLAGQPAEGRLHPGSSRGLKQTRGQLGPVLGPGRILLHGGQLRAPGLVGGLDHAHAGSLDQVVHQLAQGLARAQIHQPEGGGILLVHDLGDPAGPVGMVEQDLFGKDPGTLGVQTAAGGPVHAQIHSLLHERRVEGQGHIQVLQNRREGGSATDLVLAQLALVLTLLARLDGEGGQILRIAGQDQVAIRVGHSHADGAASARHPVNQNLHLAAGGSAHREHRGGLTLAVDAQTTGLAGAGRADQHGGGQDLVDGALGGFEGPSRLDLLDHVDADDALGVSQQGHRTGLGRIVAQLVHVHEGAQLHQGDAGHADRRVGGRSQSDRVGLVAEQVQLTAVGGQQVGLDRPEQVGGRRHPLPQSLVDVGIALQIGQGYGPGVGLAGEHERVRLLGETVDEECTGHDVLFIESWGLLIMTRGSS